jgi:hypothetical protein
MSVGYGRGAAIEFEVNCGAAWSAGVTPRP